MTMQWRLLNKNVVLETEVALEAEGEVILVEEEEEIVAEVSEVDKETFEDEETPEADEVGSEVDEVALLGASEVDEVALLGASEVDEVALLAASEEDEVVHLVGSEVDEDPQISEVVVAFKGIVTRQMVWNLQNSKEVSEGEGLSEVVQEAKTLSKAAREAEVTSEALVSVGKEVDAGEGVKADPAYSEQKKKYTNEKLSMQDVKRKQKLDPNDTKQAVLISNLPKKVETMHADFQAFVSKTVGPVKLITYNKITTPKSAAVSAICVFAEESDFKAALEKLHGQEFSGHHLLVQSFKDSRFDAHHTTRNCVCVTNMADKTTEEDLWKLFEGCGDLGMIHINRNTATGSPYEALVNFKGRESVRSAVNLDGSKVLESSVKVVNLDRKFSVLVTNIDRQVTNQEFRDLLSECNLVYFSFGVKKKKELKTAFVFLADEAGLKQALKLNGNDLKGQTIKVVSAAEKSSVETYDVFSTTIPSVVPPGEVKKVFGAFGAVSSVLVPYKKKVSRISFESAEHAQAALEASGVKINNVIVSIHPSFGAAFRAVKKQVAKAETKKALEGSDSKKVKESKVATNKKIMAAEKEAEEESENDDDSADELESEGNVKLEDDDEEEEEEENEATSGEDESADEDEEEDDSAEDEDEDVSNGLLDLEAEEEEAEDEEEEDDEMEDSAEDEGEADEGDSDEDMEVAETPKFTIHIKRKNKNKVDQATSLEVQNDLKRKRKNSGPIPKKQKKLSKK
ncbi:Nucleolar protein 12 [Frankliniella fusca]|uniref:Nucleolar protein 12 n=1 Tax=Frankliniella fusca TaxID=407009 RepID=A0AAE1H5W3_9NEOP|nr:Nucleolar protein 12 [Frankliniella fusca]